MTTSPVESALMPFWPMHSTLAFDALAEDWLAILRLNISGFDVLPHLVNLAGLHLLAIS